MSRSFATHLAFIYFCELERRAQGFVRVQGGVNLEVLNKGAGRPTYFEFKVVDIILQHFYAWSYKGNKQDVW